MIPSLPRRWWLSMSICLSLLGLVGAHASSGEGERQTSEEKTTAGRLTPVAKQFLEEAKARLAAAHEAQADRERVRQREAAQQLAIQVGREKMKQQELQARDTERQLHVARERQLKALYQQALALYRQGAYEQAAGLLQQMVVVDPTHPLVKAADRLLARAELKRFEQRVRASAKLPSKSSGASVPELEQLLTQKRMELETVLKYARSEIERGHYDTAEKLLTTVLVQDPSQRQARALLEGAQLAKLKEERTWAKRDMERDERAMINDVLKAQVLPTPPAMSVLAPLLTQVPASTISAKLQQPVTFEFTDVPLGDVIEFLSDAASVSIVPSPQLDLKTQRVSLKVRELPLEQAVKYLAKSLSLSYRFAPDAILLATSEEFSNEPLETRVFFLNSGLGPSALETSAVEPNPVLTMEPIKSLIEQTLPKVSDSKLVVDERSGSLIVTNTAENLASIERLLSQLDVTPIQVLIESRFLEVKLTELEEYAIESVLTGNASLKKTGAADGTRGPVAQINSGGGFRFPALARKTEGLNFTLQGILTGTQFETALHLLEEKAKTKTLSAPRVTTLNNQTATMRVVDEFNFPTRFEVSLIQFDINGDGDFDDAGETQFANVPKDFQKRDVGILLNVTPSVGKDLKTVTLVLAPEVSAFSQFRNLGSGVTVPEFTSSQLTTSVVIEDGQTVVLGGLMTDTTSTTLSKIPILGDLPVVGALFRQNQESKARRNLLMFITARVLAPRGPTT